VNNAGATTGTSVVTITGDRGRFADGSGSFTETYTGAVISQLVTIVSGPVTTTLQGGISYWVRASVQWFGCLCARRDYGAAGQPIGHHGSPIVLSPSIIGQLSNCRD
jgi:hypothetical protein